MFAPLWLRLAALVWLLAELRAGAVDLASSQRLSAPFRSASSTQLSSRLASLPQGSNLATTSSPSSPTSSPSMNSQTQFIDDSSQANQVELITSHYVNSQASKLRVNVSSACEKSHMHVTVRINKPFYGLIHTKEHRRKSACHLDGNGEQSYTMDISYTLNAADERHCGVVASASPSSSSSTTNQAQQSIKQQTLSVVLVVRLHKSVEFSDDRFFLLSCANRCQKADCSSADAQRSALLTSESILTPSWPLQAAQDGQPLMAGSQMTHADLTVASGPRMELNLERHQASVACVEAVASSARSRRLSLILAILLLGSVAAIVFLWVTLNQVRSSCRARVSPDAKRKRQPRTGSGIGPSNDSGATTGPQEQTDGMCWQPEVAKLRNNAGQLLLSPPHLARSHLEGQQAALANQIAQSMMAAQQQQQIDELTAAVAMNYHQLVPQQVQPQLPPQQQMPTGAGQLLIVGRAHVDELTGESPGKLTPRSQAVQRHRRRSLGSSSATALWPPAETIAMTGSNDDGSFKQIIQQSPRPMTKSRSQITIHYDQDRDPFEALPFANMLDTGYVSDGTAHAAENTCYASDGLLPHVEREYQTLSRTSDRSRWRQPRSQHRSTSQSRNEHWANQQDGPVKYHSGRPFQDDNNNCIEQSSTDVSSQFDPQNSRQLIDLIQQKHRIQMAQANKTKQTEAFALNESSKRSAMPPSCLRNR